MKRLINKTKELTKKSSRFKLAMIFIFILVLVFGYFFVKNILKDNKSEPTAITEVHITSKGFEPSFLVIKPGTKVIWINDDEKIHQIASNPYPADNNLAGMKSEILNNQQTYSYTFIKAGNFDYHDDLNPTTNATIEAHN